MGRWFYHPSKAPEGRLFDDATLSVSFDRLVSEGWTDSKKKFPGGPREGEPVKGYVPPKKEVSFLEPIIGGPVEYAPPPEPPPAPARLIEVLPEDYDSVVDFMKAFGEVSGIGDLEGRLRQAALKAGIEQYMTVKHKQRINWSMSAEELMDQAIGLEV